MSHFYMTTPERELGSTEPIESDEWLIQSGVDYWCDDCHRQPIGGLEGRQICDLCNKPCRLVQAPKLSNQICNVLLMKL